MKIASLERRVFWWAWFGAILWNGILGFGLFSDLRNHILASRFTYHQPQDLFGLMFPIIGVALLLWAIRQTVLWNVYGETFFSSDAEIFPLGGRLHGKIQFARPASTLTGRQFRLKLVCLIYNDSRNSYTAWSDFHSVDIAPDGTIPVLFSLPAEVKPKAFIMALSSKMTWDLKVQEVGGGLRSFAGEYLIPAEDYRRPKKDPFKDKL